MPTTSRRARPPRTAGDLIRGVGALLVLAVLLAGIPAGLLAVAGPPPLPSTLPGLDDLVGAITRPDDGTLLIAALTWVGWIGWATLVISIIVEVPAAVRGVRAPRLPTLGPQQRLAAGLVAAAALLFAGGTASLAAGPQAAHADQAPPNAATASASAPPDDTDPAAPDVHVVEPGDTLWDIAEHYLGSGFRYPDLYEASTHTTQSDGRRLTDPDLLYPGWKIAIPGDDSHATSNGKPTTAPAADRDAGLEDRGETPSAPATFARAESGIQPAISPDPIEVDRVELARVRATEYSTPDAAADTAADIVEDGDGGGPVDACTVGGIGAVLAGGLLLYLGTLRARQHLHRKPGQRIALPGEDGARIEDELRAVDDPATFDLVNRALRTITARCAMTGAPLPEVRFARLIQDQLELHLAESAHVPGPFLPTVSPTLWVLDSDGQLLDADQADDYAAPYPSLVTLGRDADGGLILVNLEYAGAVAVDGEGMARDEVVAAIAVELATSLWSDDVRVTVVGPAPELGWALDGFRLRALDGADIDHLLTEMSQRAAADRAALAEDGAPNVSAARVTGVAEGVWAPEVLLIAQPLTDVQRDHLAELVHAQPRPAITVVTTYGKPLTEWTIHLHPGEPDHAVLDPVGLGLTPQRIGAEDHAGLTDLLTSAHAQPASASPQWNVVGIRSNVAPTNDVAVPAVSTGTSPLVAVLGPVEIHHVAELSEPTKRAQLTALAAFLAMNPGATREAVDEAMWPGRQVSLATRNTAMAKLRQWLGADPDGNDYLPRAVDGYRLHPAVRTDWHLFTELVADGPPTASTPNLVAALDLVRDQPFKGVNPRRYIWAERRQQEMIATVGDVAEELASRALRAGDHRLALKAVMTGLLVEPGSEQLWRHRFRAHHAAGDRVALERAADQLTALADELGGELEDETIDLLNQLLSHTTAEQTRTRGRTR